MSKIAIFASGKGSNADQLMTFFKKSKDISIELVVSNKANAQVLEMAIKHEVESIVITTDDLESNDFIRLLKSKKIDCIVLAGFLKKIPLNLLQEYPNRIINIHPSLLPKYGGKGMYGNNVHKAVIENGEVNSGISIHLVNEEYDKGQMLAQFSCPVERNETISSLSKKVQALEHKHFGLVIETFLKDQIKK